MSNSRRPSQLGSVALCPKFLYKEDKSSTDSGVNLHYAYETGDMTGLSDDEVQFVNKAVLVTNTMAAKLSGITGQPVVEEKEQKVFIKAFSMPGTLDRRLRSGKIAVILDMKSGRKGIPSTAEQSVQLKCYALATLEQFPELDEVRGVLFNPRTGDQSDNLVVLRSDIPTVTAELQALIDLAEDAFATPTPGEHCARCANAARCWALKPTITQTAQALYPQMPDWFVVGRTITPVQRALRKIACTVVSNWVKACAEDDKAWMKDNAEAGLPGFKKVNSSTGVKVPEENTKKAVCALRDAGFTDDEIFGGMELSIKRTAVANAVPRGVAVSRLEAQIKETLKTLTTENKFSYYRRDDKAVPFADLLALARIEQERQAQGGTPAIEAPK